MLFRAKAEYTYVMIIHIDMDAFFASVEVREHPELEGLPVVVGGPSATRGVVAAANYVARRYGIHSAMPMSQATALCPTLKIMSVNMPLYVSVSRQIHEIFNRYTPDIEPLSLDEAFLDVSGSLRLFGSAAEIARRIKQDVRQELKLVASAGVAPNKFVAKIASDIDKPDGFVVVEEAQVQAFLDPLPIKRIWGVGKKTEQKLLNYGISTIEDIRRQTPRWMQDRFGKNGEQIYQLAHGRDRRRVVPDSRAKSISSETTFVEDISDRNTLSGWLINLTEQVAARLREKELTARTVNIKIRFQDFNTVIRSKSLGESTAQTQKIWQAVKALYDQTLPAGAVEVRLLGVGVSGFEEENQQQGDLFSEDIKYDSLDEVSDRINQRFGKLKIHRGWKK